MISKIFSFVIAATAVNVCEGGGISNFVNPKCDCKGVVLDVVDGQCICSDIWDNNMMIDPELTLREKCVTSNFESQLRKSLKQ